MHENSYVDFFLQKANLSLCQKKKRHMYDLLFVPSRNFRRTEAKTKKKNKELYHCLGLHHEYYDLYGDRTCFRASMVATLLVFIGCLFIIEIANNCICICVRFY